MWLLATWFCLTDSRRTFPRDTLIGLGLTHELTSCWVGVKIHGSLKFHMDVGLATMVMLSMMLWPLRIAPWPSA